MTCVTDNLRNVTDTKTENPCRLPLTSAAQPGAAQRSTGRSSAVWLDVAITDLLQLVHAIAIASKNGPEPAEQAGRLLTIVVNGLRPGT
ncbi:hypothetical protein GCM10009609_37060 [Pseudonocardia aurantiaca]|uniref:Transcriptional regulator SbtR-like C-terminal domain-containing protein n=1 Tax=Pseudonocardia aurantiaca TaxID=75290 RepID=A0ABW4FLV1_9PSEU